MRSALSSCSKPGLGGAVGAEAQRRDERRHRRDAEHVAAARDDVGQARVDEAPVADEVDVQLRGEDVGVEVAQRAGGGDARVGDADVDAAALGHDVVDRGGDRVGVGDVAGRPHGVAEAGRRPLGAVAVEVEQGDPMRGREAPRGLEADAASGAGDDRDGTARPGPSARHAVPARVLLVLGALAEHLRDGEGDQALHQRGEDDEEDDDEPEGGGPGAESEDHAARAYARLAWGAARRASRRGRVRWCRRSLNVAASDATTMIAYASRTTSRTLVSARSGLGSGEDTVSSCVVVQKSAAK